MEQITIIYVNMFCGECGTTYGLDERYVKELRATKRPWYCPNGHARAYAKSTADTLAEELERKNRDISDRDVFIATLELALAAAKKEGGKTKKRR